MSLGTLWTPEIQLFTDTGAPLAGGKVYFYAAGTTTPQNTYPTSALTPGTQNANPVVLDSAGRAVIFLTSSQVYKVAVTTSADVPMWTIDNLYPANYVAPNVVLTDGQTGAINNWVPTGGLSGAEVFIDWTGATDATITGLSGGVSGQRVTIKNDGNGGNLLFVQNSSSSLAANRFFNFVTSAPTPVSAFGYATYQNNGSAWELVGHEQGAWITPTFSAGNYTAASAGTWTVASGDVSVNKYKLTGTSLNWEVRLVTTTVARSAAQPTTLAIAVAAISPFTPAEQWQTLCFVADNSSQQAAVLSGTSTAVNVTLFASAQFANATDATYVSVNTTFQVT